MTLFRPAVIEAQRRRVYGSVTLHQPARLAAFTFVSLLILLALGGGVADAQGRITRPPPDPQVMLAETLCVAKQVSLNQSGTKFSLVADDKITLTESPLFYMPELEIVSWPNHSRLVPDSREFQPSIKSISLLGQDVTLGTTVFGSSFTLKRHKDGKWLRVKDLTASPAWATKLSVRWPSQLYFSGAPQENLIQQPLSDPSLDPDSRFSSTREYTGLVSRTVIGVDTFDIGSDADGNLFWRKNARGDILPLPGLNRFIFTDLSFANLSAGGVAIIGRGIYWPNPSAGTKPDISIPLYASPIVEQGTGVVHYYASPTKVIALSPEREPAARRLQTEINRWVSRGWYLHHMTASSDARKAILLFRNLSDDYAARTVASSALVFMDEDKDAAKRFICSQNIGFRYYREPPSPEPSEAPSTEVQAPSFVPEIVNGTVAIDRMGHRISLVSTIPRTRTNSELIEFSHYGHRLGLWLIQSSTRPKGTVILLRGGPSETVFDRSIGQMEHLALSAGYRLLRVDYSGSENTAFDIGARLGFDRNQSIQRDADAVMAFLKQRGLDQGQPIILLAESFGSGLAAQLLKEDADKIKKAILAVPAGNWAVLGSRQETGQSERGQRGQTLYDRLVMGAPSDQANNPIDKWYQEIRRTVCNDPRSVLIFGENDKVVKSMDWQPDCAGHLNFHILAKANHQLDSHPKALELVQAQLDLFK